MDKPKGEEKTMNQFPTVNTGKIFKFAFAAWVVGALVSLAVSGGLIYVAIHFIKKLW